MRRKLLCVLLAAVLLCMGLSGCTMFQNKVEDLSESDAAPYYALTDTFMEGLFAENYTAIYAMCAENVQKTLSRSELQANWESVRLSYGDPVEVDSRKPYSINGEGTVVSQVICTHGGCSVQLTFDENNRVAGLWFGQRETEAPYTLTPPDGVVEERLTLNEGTEYPLEAVLTLPADAQGAVPAVVLVQGSGASDKNEAIGGCYPFADLAWGLAQQGIASIRYDKRTYTYGTSFTEEQVNAMTVEEEVIADAVSAIELLAKDVRVDAARIVIAGHSLGGMLAPRIAEESGKAAGIVSLAGTARGYLDVVYDQNIAMNTDADTLNSIKKEYKKVEKLGEMKDSQTLFGIPVPYLQDLYAHPVADSLQKLSLPILVLQGESDFQISLTDYKSWQEALDGYAGGAEFHLYQNLNHLFADNSQNTRRGSTGEYLQEGHVAQEVIDDLAKWIKESV